MRLFAKLIMNYWLRNFSSTTKNERMIYIYKRGKKRFYSEKTIVGLISPPLALTILYFTGMHFKLYIMLLYLVNFYLLLGIVFIKNVPKKWKDFEKVYNEMNNK